MLSNKANSIGRSSKTVREFLEKQWKADLSVEETIRLTVKSLLEVVQTGAKNIDLAIVEGYGKIRHLTLAEIEDVVKEIEVEKVRSIPLISGLKYALILSTLLRKRRQSGNETDWPRHVRVRQQWSRQARHLLQKTLQCNLEIPKSDELQCLYVRSAFLRPIHPSKAV